MGREELPRSEAAPMRQLEIEVLQKRSEIKDGKSPGYVSGLLVIHGCIVRLEEAIKGGPPDAQKFGGLHLVAAALF
jgi:hypothetical protein